MLKFSETSLSTNGKNPAVCSLTVLNEFNLKPFCKNMGQSRICHLIDILTKSTKSISRFYPTDNRHVCVLGQETRA